MRNTFLQLLTKFSLSILIISLGFTLVKATNDQAIVATINGESISYSQIRENDALEIFKARESLYELEYAGLKSILIPKLIKLDPRSSNLTENQFISQFVVTPPNITEQDVDRFIQERRIPQEKINQNLKQQAQRFLAQQVVTQQLDQWFNEQIIKHKIKINLIKPTEPRFNVNIANSAYRGNPSAPVTIVEFSDFECPFCARAGSTLKELEKIYGNKIKLVYKHYPLSSIHPGAQKAGEASECALAQGNSYFWQLHDKMFDNFRNLSIGRIKDFAKDVGLNTTDFNQCLNEGRMEQKVLADFNEGTQLGVSSTPAFFINGRFVKGALPLNDFKKIIDEELSQ